MAETTTTEPHDFVPDTDHPRWCAVCGSSKDAYAHASLEDRAAFNASRPAASPPRVPTPPSVPTPPKYAPLGPALHDGYAIASLVLGIVWLGGLGAILAMVFGTRSLREAKEAGRAPSGMAQAGIILGILGFIGLIIAIILIVVAATNQPDPMQQWINCTNNQLSNPNLQCGPAPTS